MKIIVAYKVQGSLDALARVAQSPPQTISGTDDCFVYLLTYPNHRRILTQILARHPDKWIRIYVEASVPLDFTYESTENKVYYVFPVSLVRRNGLDRYFRLKLPVAVEPQPVKTAKSTPKPLLPLSEIREELEARGWLAKASVAYDYVYHAPYLDLLDAIRQVYREFVCDYPRCRLPSLVSNETLCRTGLAQTITHECMHVSEFVERSIEDNRAALNRIAVLGTIDEKILNHLRPRRVHLSHNCCLGFWPSLEKKCISELLTVCDQDGLGFRNEGGAANGRERFEVFRRIESIFLGTPLRTESEAKKIEEGLSAFLTAIGLPFNVLRVTPWYGGGSDEKLTLDWQVPVQSTAGVAIDVEVANLTRAGSLFSKTYDVKTPDGNLAFSGCTGLGLERMVSVFLAYHGFDPENWPSVIRKKLQKTTAVPN